MGENQLVHKKESVGSAGVDLRGAGLDYGPSRAWGGRGSAQDYEAVSQGIFENFLDLVAAVDANFVYRYLNHSHQRVLGYEPQDLLGESLLERVHPDDRKRVKAEYEEACSAHSSRSTEFRYQHSKGNYVWLRSAWNFIFDPTGTVAEVIICSHDITEQKKSQAALEDSERRFRTLSEATFEGITQVREGVFVDVNRQFAEMHGYKQDELIGMSIFTAAAPESRPVIEDAVRSHREDAFELLAKAKDGRVFPVEVRAKTICIGNRLVDLVAVRDMTERKRFEEALRTSEERLRLALEGATDAIWDWDLQTDQVSVSPRWYTMLGYEPGELPACFRTWVQLLHPEDAEGTVTAVRRAVQQDTPFGLEFRLRARNGDYIWILSRGKAVQFDSEGNPIRVAGSHTDITDRKRKDEEIRQLNECLEQRVRERTADLEAATKELEAFSYSVSHDLRAPLRAIHGYTRLFAEEHGSCLDADAHRLLTIVVTEAQRMGRLIDDLLRFSRLNKQPLQATETDMTALVRDVFDKLSGEARTREVEFRLEPLPKAKVDPSLVRQVWVNLLGNALKFSAHRKRSEIIVSGSAGENEVIYSVRDNGAGFNMKYAEKLFGVFQRLHRQDEFEGTGVGLALVQRIVHRHEGRVWAEAEVDRGATFYFSFPR